MLHPKARPMLIHLPDPDTQTLPLRGRLLGQALRAHLKRRGETLLTPVPRRTGARAVQDTMTLAALPARPQGRAAVSLGLGLPQALQHGPATLLLTASLADELHSFAGPEAFAAAGTLPLVLQGYGRAIVIDRADMAGSVGFAPWITLELADRFPVDAALPEAAAPGAPPRILILDHGAPAGQAEVLRRALSSEAAQIRIAHAQSDHAAMGAGLVADLHLHLGYGPDRAITALSPFDSLISGAYTLVLPDAGQRAGPDLRKLCAARSYGDLAPGLSELETRARAMLARIRAIRDTGARQNPEQARFAAQNAAARSEALRRFDAVLDAPRAGQEAA
ncbi:hypothetical protein [Marivita sp. GX14005]|uniref:hypothetical protein n=1 Tax=Marivita sp. GX14005 TaxID=2942276 RepID=UPI002019680A|nr:hypothetical protein [Marivita sp. GX14005]MCL3883966.1 hypothetical protein [Marivita sp. GX14005]